MNREILLLGLVALCFAASCSSIPNDSESETPGQTFMNIQSVSETSVEPGTKPMVSLLKKISRDSTTLNDLYSNFYVAQRLEEEELRANKLSDRVKIKFKKAEQLLYSGRTTGAIEEFEELQALLKSDTLNDLLGKEERRELQLLTAASYLRLGEEDNCIHYSNPFSCIVPFERNAIHQKPDGALEAAERLTEYLEEFKDDLTARWLLNVAYMALGEYPSKVPDNWLIPLKAFESEYSLERFHDVAGLMNVDAFGRAGGTVVDDFNGDNYLDIMASSAGIEEQIRLFINNADGTFTERTSEAGLTGICGGLNINHCDYDNDGDLDVFVTRGGWRENGQFPNSLLKNNGDGTFEDATVAAGLLSFHPTQTAAWGDFNNDGNLDLFIGNETWQSGVDACELYVSNGDGTFTEKAEEFGLDVKRFVKGCNWGDVNNDGYLDLYVSTMDGANLLFLNKRETESGLFRFDEIANEAGVTKPFAGFATWFFDYDNDGWLDLYALGYPYGTDERLNEPAASMVADYLGLPFSAETARLYHNNGDGTFSDVTKIVGLERPMFPMGCNYGDLDNDGFLDFYLATGAPDIQATVPNLMFRNDSGRKFQDVTTAGGFGHLHRGHSVAFADIDNDGDEDIYTVMGGAYEGSVSPNILFENPGAGGNWVSLKLEGQKTNRAALGARITVFIESKTGVRKICRTVSSGSSFGGNPFQQHIGIGQAEIIKEIEVFWPVSGLTQTFTDIEINKLYRIIEGKTEIQPIRVNPLKLGGQGMSLHSKGN